MRILSVLFLICLAIAGLGLSRTGTLPPLYTMLALAGAAAALLTAWWLRRTTGRYTVIDGSNVIFWGGGAGPDLDRVRRVVDAVEAQGRIPVVWFDANVGYRVGDRYLGPAALAQRLGITARQVMVAPSGTPADPLIIDSAHKLGAAIVTNDRYRDWQADNPWLAEPGALIRGRVEAGTLTLTPSRAPRQRPAA